MHLILPSMPSPRHEPRYSHTHTPHHSSDIARRSGDRLGEGWATIHTFRLWFDWCFLMLICSFTYVFLRFLSFTHDSHLPPLWGEYPNIPMLIWLGFPFTYASDLWSYPYAFSFFVSFSCALLLLACLSACSHSLTLFSWLSIYSSLSMHLVSLFVDYLIVFKYLYLHHHRGLHSGILLTPSLRCWEVAVYNDLHTIFFLSPLFPHFLPFCYSFNFLEGFFLVFSECSVPLTPCSELRLTPFVFRIPIINK